MGTDLQDALAFLRFFVINTNLVLGRTCVAVHNHYAQGGEQDLWAGGGSRDMKCVHTEFLSMQPAL